MHRTEKSSSALALVCYLLFRAHMLYHYGQPWLALQCLNHAQGKLVYLTGWINHAYFYLLHSLCQLALLAKYPPTPAGSTLAKDSATSGSARSSMEVVQESVHEGSASPEAVAVSGHSAGALDLPPSSGGAATLPPSPMGPLHPSTNFKNSGKPFGMRCCGSCVHRAVRIFSAVDGAGAATHGFVPFPLHVCLTCLLCDWCGWWMHARL
jgi:hypothetical protein